MVLPTTPVFARKDRFFSMRALSDARRTPFDPARAICSPRTTLRVEQTHVANAGVLACIGCRPAAGNVVHVLKTLKLHSRTNG
jgi:hypothetical protein